MPDVFLGIGIAVVKIAAKLWLKADPLAADLGGSVVDVIAGQVSDRLDKRRARRLVEHLEEMVQANLESSIGHEVAGLAPNEREATLLAVADSFERARLTDADLFAADLDPLFLERHIRASSPDATRDLESRAVALYDLLLARCCAYVIEVIVGLPPFAPTALKEILHRESEVLAGIKELLDRLPSTSIDSGLDEVFLAAYLQQVARTLDQLELFGVTVSESIRHYPLSVAYISLNVTGLGPSGRWVTSSKRAITTRTLAETLLGDIAPGNAAGSPAATGFAGVPRAEEDVSGRIDEVVQRAPRLFLRGDAGSGKTTLLQWIAVRNAQKAELVPFLIPLRHYVGRELPTPREFVRRVGRHIADEMPPGWVQRELRGGKAIVLIDGVDELPESQRDQVKEWLRELLAAFPKARYVVTSRPTAAARDWLDAEGFDTAELQPMSWPDVRFFIGHWHKALATTSTYTAEQLESYEATLLQTLHNRRHLRALATNPLLCALLCALHLDRRMQLPRDRMELYSIALDMLLERRDTERHILSEGGSGLSRTDKTLVLQGLAYWLIRNGRSDAPYAQAVAEVGRCLAQMPRTNIDPAAVLKQLLDRSGLIRTPVADRVDFVHRTFQEYLAARAAVEADDIGAIVRNAHDDHWREVVILAAGHAQPRQRTELLQGLLDRAERDPVNSKLLRVLAVACLETCAQLDTTLQDKIRQVARTVLPPRNLADAESLAKSGEFVLDLLADSPARNSRQAVATIRAATGIGGPAALSLIARCAHFGDHRVHAELMRAWPHFDPFEYARTVLRPSEHRRQIGTLTDAALIPAVVELPDLEYLAYEIDPGYGKLDFVRELPRLANLQIFRDPMLSDLSPLVANGSITHLALGAVGDVEFAVLPDLPHLRRLTVSGAGGRDLTPLRSCASLEALALDELDIQALPGCLPTQPLKSLAFRSCLGLTDLRPLDSFDQLVKLEELYLFRCDVRDISGIEERFAMLSHLSLAGNPGIADCAALGSLTNLTGLALSETSITDIAACARMPGLANLGLDDLPQVPDLTPLRGLAHLATLHLRGSGRADLRPLAGMQGLTVHVDRRQEVVGAELLGDYSRVLRR
ncbi:MAG TPA: NACHT domain-containing protein [Streptosporangiaceae bacterium]|nr:NACHT domain-containing protein [Streptosporangiaceae bacterium]